VSDLENIISHKKADANAGVEKLKAKFGQDDELGKKAAYAKVDAKADAEKAKADVENKIAHAKADAENTKADVENKIAHAKADAENAKDDAPDDGALQ
jgi:F0F1-type ATP synthase membrane subunit b/b'